LLFSGGGKHTYHLRFQNAGQLVKDDDVQIGGRRIGSIREIKLTDDNQADVTIEVEDHFTPLHKGTTATIRATSLSGIANRYVALSLGPNSANKLASGSTIPADKTTAPVDLDQVFNTLDAPTRKALQRIIHGQATWYTGRAKQTDQSLKYLNPALYQSSSLARELVRDRVVFQEFVTDTSNVVTDLADRQSQLTDLVSNANETAGAIGSENVALSQTLDVLPQTLRNANTTLVNLRSTLDDLD